MHIKVSAFSILVCSTSYRDESPSFIASEYGAVMRSRLYVWKARTFESLWNEMKVQWFEVRSKTDLEPA